ncbi:nitrate reductase, partial [Streptomyces mutabilis]|uniref:molybdopterin dinucleotide binding domain-containing protein n=1 Tax=Streptomyces mutabilis TaxID=67332 RepID=UPI0022D1BC1E|nr:nitrate reductase [Streptomyces mutabilis]
LAAGAHLARRGGGRGAGLLGLGEGDLVEVAGRRGALRGRLRVTGIRPGLLFVPFHYGYWDTGNGSGPGPDTLGRAANEATVTDWDPVSKQPLFKTATASLTLVERADGRPSPAPTTTASAPATVGAVHPTAGGDAAHATQAPAQFPHGREEGAQ